ncbi:unnamed protein product [Amoebophrya sp. A25]|nr:unnamed protein product [Amoebophrya sp. A25]|eukprot:GSA25T00011454001.1
MTSLASSLRASTRGKMARFVSLLVSSSCLLSTTLGEKFRLSRIRQWPDSRTFEILHYFTVDDVVTSEFSITGPVTFENLPSTFTSMQLHVLHHSLLENEKKIQFDHFCCEEADIERKECRTKQAFIYTDQEKPQTDAYSFMLDKSTFLSGFSGQLFKPKQEGLYFLAISNCGDQNYSKDAKFISGDVGVVSVNGFLPAEEMPKLSFYLFLSALNAVALMLWIAYCWAWSDVLFIIHKFITCALACSVVEAACWYASLSHWNMVGTRWWGMMILATLGTTVKQGVCYALLLLACLGIGVTHAKPEKKTLTHVVLVTVAFVITDTWRQVEMFPGLSNIDVNSSTLEAILYVAPGSFFVSWIVVWIMQSLQQTIQDLQQSKQEVKAEVYQNLRLALISVCGGLLLLLIYESIVVRQEDLSQNWSSRWIFTDAASHAIFFFLTVVTAFLWRPNENTHAIAYSQQVQGEEDAIELGNVRIDEEFDDDDAADTKSGGDPARTLE